MTQNQISFAKLQEEKRHNQMSELVDMGTLNTREVANAIQSAHNNLIDPYQVLKLLAESGLIQAQTTTEQEKPGLVKQQKQLYRAQEITDMVLRDAKYQQLTNQAELYRQQGLAVPQQLINQANQIAMDYAAKVYASDVAYKGQMNSAVLKGVADVASGIIKDVYSMNKEYGAFSDMGYSY